MPDKMKWYKIDSHYASNTGAEILRYRCDVLHGLCSILPPKSDDKRLLWMIVDNENFKNEENPRGRVINLDSEKIY